jgi:hypothetical protein
MSPPPARHVRRLHVRAAVEDDARHAATLLTDALSTASLPAADQGRLIVIQRLALGRISTRVSPASLALHIELATRDAILQAVTYDRAAAGAANAVVFPDRSEAIIALARLHALGFAADEWFWPSIVGGWRTGLSRRERWLLLLDGAHSVPESPIVAAAILAQAIAAGAEDELLSSIPRGQGADWLRLEGWSRIEPEPSRPPTQRLNRRIDVIERWRRRWETADDRLVWLATMLAVLEQPARVADPCLPATVARILKDFERRDTALLGGKPEPVASPDQSEVRENPAVTESEPRSVLRSDARSIAVGDRSVPADSASPHAPTTGVTGDGPSSTPCRQEARAEHDLEHPQAYRHSGFFTPCAGLLFVVPILERLEFAQFLAAHPMLLERGFPARLLWFIGRHSGLRPDDPLALAFKMECGDESDDEAQPGGALDSPFEAWLTAVRRWCRRHPRVRLTALVRRPGNVFMSRTHIEACFAVSQADMRLRRLALDLDPGWVPWMGRVVQFRYGDHDRG